MKLHNLTQGTPEWLAYRAQHFNASDAPAMMGVSPYKTRAELLREMHTGVAADVDAATQRIFDAGHRFEALARPLAENIVGQDLYPVVGSEGRLSASFDGLTMDERTAFEHKSLNDDLRAAFADMQTIAPEHRELSSGRCLPLVYRVQMEQQLYVSGAERCLFMASRWADDGTMLEERHCWYYPDPKLRAQILAGWDQFAKDLAEYVPPAAAKPAPVAKRPDSLPALRVEVSGQVTASNLAEFRETALSTIRAINTDLRNDQDFADAEAAVKWCADVESRLAAAKEHALSQTASIDELFRAIDDISAEARKRRLALDKLVTQRKAEIRDGVVLVARQALTEHIKALEEEIRPARINIAPVDFAAAVKGKRTLASLQDAVDTALAQAKIAADAQAREIRGRLALYRELASGLEFLFADLVSIVHKADDDFSALLRSRIDKHQADEKAKRESAAAAQAAIAAAQSVTTQPAASMPAAQGEVAGNLAQSQPVAPCFPAGDATAEVGAGASPRAQACAPAAASVNEMPTLKLGAICSRLGITMTAAFVADTLGIPSAGRDKAAVLYRESQFPAICAALAKHVSRVASEVAAAA